MSSRDSRSGEVTEQEYNACRAHFGRVITAEELATFVAGYRSARSDSAPAQDTSKCKLTAESAANVQHDVNSAAQQELTAAKEMIANLQAALPSQNAPAADPWATFELRHGGYVYVKRSHARRRIAALEIEIDRLQQELTGGGSGCFG